MLITIKNKAHVYARTRTHGNGSHPPVIRNQAPSTEWCESVYLVEAQAHKPTFVWWWICPIISIMLNRTGIGGGGWGSHRLVFPRGSGPL